MALTNGMPIESVSRILGHTNITTTQIYAKITTEKLNTDLTALGNKLSNTFNGIKIAWRMERRGIITMTDGGIVPCRSMTYG